MNDAESHIAEQIRLKVWSGLKRKDEIQEMVTGLLTEHVDEDMIRKRVELEFKRKASDQKSWPSTTGIGRLIAAFDALQGQGMIARHRAGWDKSEAFHDCLEMNQTLGRPDDIFGICYYTIQDLESVLDGRPLHIGFSSARPENEASDAARAGQLVLEELKRAGLDATWSGNVRSSIEVQMKWQLKTRSTWWRFWDNFIRSAAGMD